MYLIVVPMPFPAAKLVDRGVKNDACGRSFAVLSTQVSTVGLRLRQNRLTFGSILEVSRDAAARQEKNNSSVVQRSTINIALSVLPLALAAIFLSRLWVVGSVFAAALTQVSTVVMPPAVAAKNIGVGPCRGGWRVATCLRRWRALPLGVQWFK
jgi:hypothetical protein